MFAIIGTLLKVCINKVIDIVNISVLLTMFAIIGTLLKVCINKVKELYYGVFYKHEIKKRTEQLKKDRNEVLKKLAENDIANMKNAEEERLQQEKKDLENKLYLSVLQEQGNIEISDNYRSEENWDNIDDMPSYEAPQPSQFEKDLKDFREISKKLEKVSLVQLCRKYLNKYEERIDINDTRGIREYNIDKLVEYFRNHEDEFIELKNGYLQILQERKELSGKSCGSQADNAFQSSHQNEQNVC